MKKIIISAVVLAMSVMAMATETAYVKVRLTGVTGGVSSSVTLVEDDANTSAFEPGADIERLISYANSNSVLMYGLVGTTPCQDVVTNQLDGVKLGLGSNMVDTDYKLKFINVSGRALKIFDRVAGKLIDVVDNAEYDFSIDPSEVGQKRIDDRFEIGEPAQSFCFTYNKLEVIGYKGKSLVIKNGTTVIDSQASLDVVYVKDLSAQPANTRLVVTLDSKDYIIDVNPSVTIVP